MLASFIRASLRLCLFLGLLQASCISGIELLGILIVAFMGVESTDQAHTVPSTSEATQATSATLSSQIAERPLQKRQAEATAKQHEHAEDHKAAEPMDEDAKGEPDDEENVAVLKDDDTELDRLLNVGICLISACAVMIFFKPTASRRSTSAVLCQDGSRQICRCQGPSFLYLRFFAHEYFVDDQSIISTIKLAVLKNFNILFSSVIPLGVDQTK